MYADTSTNLNIADTDLSIKQTTDYPNDGKVIISLDPEKPTTFTAHLRIPTWTGDQFVPGKLYKYVNQSNEDWSISVNGAKTKAKVVKGFATIKRTWKKGDQIVLDLPMPLQINECDNRVEENQNRLAFTRGPFVLCAEEVDNEGATQRFFLNKNKVAKNFKLASVTLPSGSFSQVKTKANAVDALGKEEDSSLSLIPYYAWNNRKPGSMTIWFPTTPKLAVFDPHKLPKKSVFSSIEASHTSELDTASAVGDGKEPKWSSGKSVPRWTSRPQLGKAQWIEGQFSETRKVRDIGVYWMQDQQDVKFPQEWSLEVRNKGEWKPFELYVTDRYDNRANQYNVVHPAAPLTCDAIRINMVPQPDAAVGILEVQVAFEK